MRTIVGIFEICVADYVSGAGRMNEFAVPCVDAHVIHTARGTPEEYEVAGAQRLARNRRRGLALIGSGARHLEAELVERVENETAAVEAGARILAAELV